MSKHYLMTDCTQDWETPKWLYQDLDSQFHFDDDPCPVGGTKGLEREWGSSVFVNPPYRRSEIRKWIVKAIEEYKKGKLIVMLLKATTDTKWFHELVLPNANIIIFIKGRLRYRNKNKIHSAPFPSMIVCFVPDMHSQILICRFNQDPIRKFPVVIGKNEARSTSDKPHYPDKERE